MNQRQLSDIDNSLHFLPLPLHYRYRVRWVPDYIDKVSNWADRWYVDFYKFKYLLISSKNGVTPSLYMNCVLVSPASDFKHLGLLLSGNGT